MKFIFLVFILMNITMAKESQSINLGYFYEKFFVSEKTAKLGVKLWNKQIKKLNYGLDIKIKFYDRFDTLISDYNKSKKLDVISISPYIYFENIKILKNITKEMWSLKRVNTVFETYYLIKQKNKNLSFKDIRNKKVFLKKGDDSASIWFDSLILDRFKKSSFDIINRKTLQKTQSVVLQVFFNKDDFAVVSKTSFDSMKELNPQILRKVEIIKKSKPIFLSTIGLIRKDINEDKSQQMKELSKSLNKQFFAKDVLALANIDKVIIITSKDLQEYRDFYLKYKKNQDLFSLKKSK